MSTFRIGASQFKLSPVVSFQEFEQHLNSIIQKCATNKVDMLLLPEYFSMQLVGLLDNVEKEPVLFKKVASYSPKVVDFLARAAKQSNLYIIAGSMPVIEGDKIYNDSYVLSPGGDIFFQGKLNMTTYEREDVFISPRNQLKIFDSKFGKFAINICYDIEFPEIARSASNHGAQFILVPTWTDDSHGFWRVRHCAQARCVENHIYVIQSSVVGALGKEPAQGKLCGQSAILSPCDKGFPDNGILAKGNIDSEDLVISDLDLELLNQVKLKGATTPCSDKQFLDAKLASVETIVLGDRLKV